MAASLSLTLDEIDSLIELISSCETLSPSLLNAASKLQAKALAFRHPLQDSESLLLTPPASTPVHGRFVSFLREDVGIVNQ